MLLPVYCSNSFWSRLDDLVYVLYICLNLQNFRWQFTLLGFPGGSDGKESTCNAGDPGSIPASGKIPWRSKWKLTPVFLPREFHGERSLVGCSPWSGKESHRSKWITHSRLPCYFTSLLVSRKIIVNSFVQFLLVLELCVIHLRFLLFESETSK